VQIAGLTAFKAVVLAVGAKAYLMLPLAKTTISVAIAAFFHQVANGAPKRFSHVHTLNQLP
jgi:hypothetical protein